MSAAFRAAAVTAAACMAMTAGGAARAAVAARLSLALPAQSYGDSLIAIGIAGRLSLVGVAACRGRAPALKGVYTAQEAFVVLLRDAGCRYTFVADDTVRFVRAPAASAPRLATPAPARPPSPKPLAADVSEVVVTAQKRSEFLFQTAGGVSVMGAQRLAQTSVLDVGDVAAQIAAVVLTNLGPGRDKLLLRGVSDGAFTGRARSTVASFLDDAPITYNAPDPDLVLADVSRIEILRGPQGALYGGGSIGGVYRIATNPPQLDAFAGSIQVRGALTQQGAGSSGVETTLNAPLITDRLGARLTLYQIDDGGYLQDQSLRSSNVDRTRRTGGRAAFKARLAPDWTVTLSGAVQHLTTADTQYTTLPGKNPLRRANLVREGHKNDFNAGTLSIDGRLGDLRLHSSTSYVRHDFTNVYDASAALSLFDAPAAEFGAYDEAVHSEMVSGDVYLSSPESLPFSWLAGASTTQLTQDTPSALSARVAGLTTPQMLYSETRRDRLGEAALYGEMRLKPLSRWTVSLGARVFYDDWDVRAVTLTPRQKPFTRSRVDHSGDTALSPKLSVQYAFNDTTSVYALASRGDRPGGFNTGAIQAPTADRRAYAPDRLLNYEAGLKTRFWGGQAEVQATVFHDVWRRIQTDQYYPSGLPYTANVGDGRLSGIEADAGLRLFTRLKLEANALFTTSEVVNAAPGFAQGLHKGLSGAPQAAGVLYAAWDQPLPRGVDLLLSGRASYVGHSRLTYDVTAASTTSASLVDAELSAQLLFGRYRLALNLKNPADDRANTFAFGNPFSFGQVRQVTPQRPRTLELVASAGF